MGACHSDLKHNTEDDSSSLDYYKNAEVNSQPNSSEAEHKEPPTFQELCAKQQELVAKNETLRKCVAEQTRRQSFRNELEKIVLRGPTRLSQNSEGVPEELGENEPSTPRVKLSYRLPPMNGTPEMRAVVDRYFDTLEELKKFVVSDEIYLEPTPLSTDDERTNEHDLPPQKETADEEGDDNVEVGTKDANAVEEGETAAVDKTDSVNATLELRSTSTPVTVAESFSENSVETVTKATKKKKKDKKGRKTKLGSCFSSEVSE